jgi:PQQ-dependent dehydrogenase (methanol/ethanol family)
MEAQQLSILWLSALLLVSVAVSGCGENHDADVGTKPSDANSSPGIATSKASQRLVDADSDAQNWLTYGRTYKEQRHSPLTEVDEKSVDRLGLSWYADMGTNRGLEATPLVVDGVMYVTGAWSILYAFDAASGKRLWTYDPRVNRGHARYVCCDVVNRGAAFFDHFVYFGAIDGRLIAVDAKNGELAWEVQTTPVGKAYSITGAPRIADGKVLIGNGGAEFGVRGYVSAYDARTGRLIWRTYTVPGDPSDGQETEWLADAAATWTGNWWQAGAGGTAWDSIVYDPELGLVYIGVGNGSPWYSRLRSPGGGDNLFLASILAVRVSDGEYVWHYQTTPGDNWDYTATQPLMLATLSINGESRRVIMQAPKNGFFYVLDRESGEFISAQAFANVTWATGITPEGRPIENPVARKLEGGVHVAPGPAGSHSWHPMSFNPDTGLVYFSVSEHSELHSPDDSWEYDSRRINIGGDFLYDGETSGEEMPLAGRLVAWDPVTQREVWRAAHPDPLSGGTLSTAGGIVFQGRADGRFRAYRATDGKVLWEYEQETGIVAAPVTYSVDGAQYIAVLAGFGGPEVLVNTPLNSGKVGPGRLLVFALDGDTSLPEPLPKPGPIPAPTVDIALTAEEYDAGERLFSDNCVGCHGIDAVSGGITPDLRGMTEEVHQQLPNIVLGGSREPLGMPRFDDVLTKEDLTLIQGYIIARAKESAGDY